MRGAMGLRVLGLMAVLAFVMSAFTQMPNLMASSTRPRPRLDPADAIVVLAGGIHQDGALTASSLRRAVHGISLHRKDQAKFLVLSGPPAAGGPAEAAVRSNLARELGVPAEALLTEEEVWTTRQEAARIWRLLQARGARRIILVTDSQHMPRAQAVFERAGFEVVPSEADDVSRAAADPEERLRLARRIVQEYIARLYYRLAGYL